MKMFEAKYGNYSPAQMHDYKKTLHSRIHWFLVYYETGFKDLDRYIGETLFYLNGLNRVLKYPASVVHLTTMIENIRIYLNSPDFTFAKYRKLVLDAHSVIDTLPEWTTEGSDPNE